MSLLKLADNTTSNAELNHIRLKALHDIRWGFLLQAGFSLPIGDTKWYRVPLAKHISKLTSQWLAGARAEVKPPPQNPDLSGLIAWGHNTDKLLLFEGNHRFTQWEHESKSPFDDQLQIIIGISPSEWKWFEQCFGHK